MLRIAGALPILSALLFFKPAAHAFDGVEQEARFIYQRLSGRTLRAGTPVYNQMVDLIRKNQRRDAALLATQASGFVGGVVRHWGAQLLTNESNPSLALNDSLAMLMGAVRDNLDARLLLTGNFIYGADPRLNYDLPTTEDNLTFMRLESQYRELDRVLYYYEPQWKFSSINEVAGMLTTRYWSSANYSAGTNRRAVVNTFQSFLCLPIATWKRPNLPTFRIRQDIDRFPQGDARVFQTECRTCHASMDAFAGAFAGFDFTNESISWTKEVNPKYLIHSDVYPDGYVTHDKSWLNLLHDDPQDMFGWGPMVKGYGISEFGKMLSESRVFGDCMVKRTIKTLCRTDLAVNAPLVQELSKSFRSEGYKLKDLFAKVVIQPECRELFLQSGYQEDQ